MPFPSQNAKGPFLNVLAGLAAPMRGHLQHLYWMTRQDASTFRSHHVTFQSWRMHISGCFRLNRELIHRFSFPACHTKIPEKTIITDSIDIPQPHKRHAQRSKYSSSFTPSKMRHPNPTNYSSHAPHPSSRPYSLSTHPRWSHHQQT